MLSTKMIGNKIAEARRKLNISQAQLAQNLFISSQAVGKWERGESMPDIITFNRLAEIMGVDLNYFSEGFQSTPPEVEPVGLSENKLAEFPSGKQNKQLRWDMSLGNWVEADFSELKNLNDKFSYSNMQRCKFNGSDLSGLLLKGNHVDGCDFSGSCFSNSHIEACHIVNNLFKECNLNETVFSISHINRCDFTGADFNHVIIKLSDFSKNITFDAVWNHTSFINTQLTEIVFESSLKNCYFENCAFSKVTFQNVTLTDTFFKCKSLKRIKFFDCKADKMTYAFLKSGKADMSGITLMESMK